MGHRRAAARRGQRGLGANGSRQGVADQSLRQVVRVSTGGSTVRIRLSNAYGTTPLRITAATVGRPADGAQVWPGTSRKLTTDGSRGVAIAPSPASRTSSPSASPPTTDHRT
ncbi:hypothetical protein [Streptomyces parvus]|uniref:hypothetical protein n=1 Tax=Streptomyces parvus TaxID=66428 RepID=UPI0030B8BDDA